MTQCPSVLRKRTNSSSLFNRKRADRTRVKSLNCTRYSLRGISQVVLRHANNLTVDFFYFFFFPVHMIIGRKAVKERQWVCWWSGMRKQQSVLFWSVKCVMPELLHQRNAFHRPPPRALDKCRHKSNAQLHTNSLIHFHFDKKKKKSQTILFELVLCGV